MQTSMLIGAKRWETFNLWFWELLGDIGILLKKSWQKTKKNKKKVVGFLGSFEIIQTIMLIGTKKLANI